MLILALDSAMNGCSAGLHDFRQNIHISKNLEISRGQAEHLIPMINDVLVQSNKEYNDIEMIAVTHGPGAFTGIRIAMATAKSLGLALDIPVIGICTFDAVLHSSMAKKGVPIENGAAVILETKRDDFYFRLYDAEQKPASEKLAISADDVLKLIMDGRPPIVGDAVNRFLTETQNSDNTVICDVINYPDTKSIAYIASDTHKKSTNTCIPVYIRPPDACLPKNLRRIKRELL
ncbi:MAG: tRNA (adenosine(37)-N6)-threonylcarbamoyltransferase complex dimerization subunit type 1 TsaB [Alphaproteobacteria bacterium]